MAKIVPFKAVRPAEDKVALVTTRAYDEYSAAELASWLDFNPYSFLHIINPAYINQQRIDQIRRYQLVGTKYQDFKNNKVFVKEENPVMFLYEIQSETNTFMGILAGTSLQEYVNDKIKRHENTLEYRVQNMKNYFKIARFNTEPVLMMHQESPQLDAWIEEKRKETPLYNFATTNKENHKLWKIEGSEEIQQLQDIFSDFKELFIADGHHRVESIRQLVNELENIKAEDIYFMSYLVCEKKIKINPYHRVVHDLNGLSERTFFEEVSKSFHVRKVHDYWKPKKKYQFAMYINHQFYALELIEKPKSSTDNILNLLDAEILFQKLLEPILGIEDLRTDSRIAYLPGNKSLVNLVNVIDNGEYQVGFMLFPSTVDDIKKLATFKQTMPPKSTYIEPKIRNGLVIYEY